MSAKDDPGTGGKQMSLTALYRQLDDHTGTEEVPYDPSAGLERLIGWMGDEVQPPAMHTQDDSVSAEPRPALAEVIGLQLDLARLRIMAAERIVRTRRTSSLIAVGSVVFSSALAGAGLLVGLSHVPPHVAMAVVIAVSVVDAVMALAVTAIHRTTSGGLQDAVRLSIGTTEDLHADFSHLEPKSVQSDLPSNPEPADRPLESLADAEASSFEAIAVNLARRFQSLVERQIPLIDELEQGEQDPERLGSLFQMDHLATRMRRHSENLLVLAGHDSSRRWNQPVALVDVLRAAISEIEQYERVMLNVQPGIAVRGPAVNDVVHLIAELAENATSFSSADTPISVSGYLLSSGGVLLDITDHGVGMGAEEMAQANWRLDNPPVMDVAVSRRMGLFVVARLAARHDIRVRLRPAADGGLTALVWLPDAIVTGEAMPEGQETEPEGSPRTRSFRSSVIADSVGSAPVSYPSSGFPDPDELRSIAEASSQHPVRTQRKVIAKHVHAQARARDEAWRQAAQFEYVEHRWFRASGEVEKHAMFLEEAARAGKHEYEFQVSDTGEIVAALLRDRGFEATIQEVRQPEVPGEDHTSSPDYRISVRW